MKNQDGVFALSGKRQAHLSYNDESTNHMKGMCQNVLLSRGVLLVSVGFNITVLKLALSVR